MSNRGRLQKMIELKTGDMLIDNKDGTFSKIDLSLSDKIENPINRLIFTREWNENRTSILDSQNQFIAVDDVREAVRLLKDKVDMLEKQTEVNWLLNEIKIIFGQKLIECSHDWGNSLLMSNAPQRKCIKCGKTEYVNNLC
jgi:hypothetical protein